MMARRTLSRSARLAALAALLSITAPGAPAAPRPMAFTVTSSVLGHGVPETYTANAFGCAGGNQSPPLHWRGAPAGTKSFVVTLFDRDEHSTPSGWWHWVVYDLPATVTELPAGAGSEHSVLLPAGTRQGRTDLGNMAYHGPCPDKGDAPHRYVFTVYAVDVARLPIDDDASGAMVTATVRDHLLGKAVLSVRHGR